MFFGGVLNDTCPIQVGSRSCYISHVSSRFKTDGAWAWGTAKSHEELDEADWEFWRSRTPEERLAATFQASIDAWMLRDGEPAKGIDLSVYGVRKLGEELEDES